MAVVTVTGAAGFIGLTLAQSLTNAGHRVRAVIRRRNKRRPRLAGVEYFECRDISDLDEWSAALDGADAVVHLVSRVHVMKTAADDAAEYHRVNVEGSTAVARACVERSVKRLVYLSTIKVNGETTGARPFTADDPPAQTREPYARTKRETEAALFDLGRETGLEVVVIRPPLVYGPRVKGNFRSMMRAVEKEWPLPLASVANVRSMVSVFNLCDLIETCVTHPAAAGEVFLVSDGEDVSTPQLIRLLAGAMQREARLVACPVTLLRFVGVVLGQGGKIARLCGDLRVDTRKTRRLLDWTPPMTLAEGIERTVRDRG